MSEWGFVAAAYGAMLVASAGLLAWSWGTMRRAEASVDALRRRD